jgi:lipoic acid synthetase
MGLSHVVVTSVTRDDLPDGGASVFAATIHAVRAAIDGATVEVLVPDFGGSIDALQQVVDAGPDVINHNLETVRRLYAAVRDRASYERSLELLDRCRNLNGNIITKSGIMVGLGETTEEILALIQDVAHTGCRAMTIGQYLRPTSRHRPVERFYTPDEFAELEQSARSIGIREVCAGPLVRSSYRAAAVLRRLKGEAGTGSQT